MTDEKDRIKKDNINNQEQKMEKELSKMENQLSAKKSFGRIIVALFAFIWFLAGGSAQNVLALTGGSLGLVGLVSFLIRNPITFFIIGIIQVILGLIFYLFFSGYYFMIIFHFLWSIRWFYGYHKYRRLKISENNFLNK